MDALLDSLELRIAGALALGSKHSRQHGTEDSAAAMDVRWILVQKAPVLGNKRRGAPAHSSIDLTASFISVVNSCIETAVE